MKQSRRDFLSAFGRIILLSGLVFVTGSLLLKEKDPAETCPVDFICEGCKKAADCRLPEGIAFREMHQGTLTNNTKQR